MKLWRPSRSSPEEAMRRWSGRCSVFVRQIRQLVLPNGYGSGCGEELRSLGRDFLRMMLGIEHLFV